MSLDEQHRADPVEKIVRMANQIATFFRSKTREEGLAGLAEHINKFWEPRMRRHLFQVLDAGGPGLDELVLAAADRIRRPAAALTPEQERHGAAEFIAPGPTSRL